MSSRRILIVDDENSLRKVLSDLLRLRGYEPVAIGSGEDALAYLTENPIEVALIDLALNKGGGTMDGMELLRRVREGYPSIQCVVLTGVPSQQSAIAAVSAGAFSYLLKPFNLSELVGTLERAIEKHREQIELSSARQRANEASNRSLEVAGRIRSDCLPALTGVVGLTRSVMEAETLADARAFGERAHAEARRALGNVEEVVRVAENGSTP
ncbi:MAG: response regulator [Lentisphaeria bacterium]|nr:response regulator [Lentisphaeria bacterium]